MTTYAESLEASRWTWEANEKHVNETAMQMIEHYGWNASLSYAEIKEFLSYTERRKQKKTTDRVRKVYCCLREQLGREPQKESEAELSEIADASRERREDVSCGLSSI